MTGDILSSLHRVKPEKRQDYKNLSSEEFYHYLKADILQEIKNAEPLSQSKRNIALHQFLENYSLTSNVSMMVFRQMKSVIFCTLYAEFTCQKAETAAPTVLALWVSGVSPN
ncbi:MAG: hypothetical protein B6247_22790 [Candidatus Parabeggiatoa sp. nov. 2]|nr:MAG: hypothetical protein B6247_22790 [Beggiatoa sp. 4572_84]